MHLISFGWRTPATVVHRTLWSGIMYHPTEYKNDLVNSNCLHERQGDESPIIVRSLHRSTYFDDEVDIQPTSERPLRTSSHGLSKREKLMIAGLIFLGILLIVFIVLFASKGKPKESHHSKLSIILAAGKYFSIRPDSQTPRYCDSFIQYLALSS